ncbi:uncharacterized protein LOC127708904 [Mytilus californianus]|uniref:uncharacterized protein LOC127708904 n=1 Tax=Mytilus californianus TaxID=6549 RepID=UPI002246C4B2|nr:uncharacterized protein LOC127708904 [Mytilus californianus]
MDVKLKITHCVYLFPRNCFSISASTLNARYYDTMYLEAYFLFGFMYSVKGTTFKVTSQQNVLNTHFDCGTGYEVAGKNAFSNCQPETCKKINLKGIDKTININDTYWVNGYVLMSPIMEYLGCFDIKSAHINTDSKNISDNDVLNCVLFCQERGFKTNDVILFKKKACSCLTQRRLIEQTKRSDSSMNENHNARCSEQCPGDNTDECGGSNYFSVYNITENRIRGREHSCVCENLQNPAHSMEECKICPVDLQFLCLNTSDKDDRKQMETNCTQIPLTWRQTLTTCLKSGAYFKISTRSGESCYIAPVSVNTSDFQYSFVKLLFVWNTRPKSKYDYKCLGLRLEEKKVFKLLSINCTEKRKALCHKVSNEDLTEGLGELLTEKTTLKSTPYTTVFNVSEANHTWDRAANDCIDGWTLSGEGIFNSCRSDSCQTINANDMLPYFKMKPPFLWINGSVVRSPVMEYYECLNFTNVKNTVNALRKHKTLYQNGVEKCSLFCKQDEYLKDKDFIFLQNDTCYCVPDKTQQQWVRQEVVRKVSTKICDIRCDEDNVDRCGGTQYIFSAYKLIGLSSSEEIGGNCFYTFGNSHKVNRISCKEGLQFKCEEVKQSDGTRKIDVRCFESKLNWYDARKTCNTFTKYIQLLNNQCDNDKQFADKLWHNRFVKERIVWNADIPTDMYKKNGYICLAIKLTKDSKYILTAQNCDKNYHSLCQKDVWDTNGITTNNEQETGDSKVSMVSIYVGIAVTLAILLIFLIVLAVCVRRRKRSMHKEVPAATDVYYSTVTGDQIIENQPNTPDCMKKDQSDANLLLSAKRVNNHAEYDQQEINQKGTVYDQAGLPDSDEYDVSSTCRKNRPNVEEDVCYYDHNRDVDTVYDETDTHGLIQRNEISEIYDHTREINDDYDVSQAYRQQGKTINEPVYSKSDF